MIKSYLVKGKKKKRKKNKERWIIVNFVFIQQFNAAS